MWRLSLDHRERVQRLPGMASSIRAVPSIPSGSFRLEKTYKTIESLTEELSGAP